MTLDPWPEEGIRWKLGLWLRSSPLTVQTTHVHPISGARDEYDGLLDLVGDRGSS